MGEVKTTKDVDAPVIVSVANSGSKQRKQLFGIVGGAIIVLAGAGLLSYALTRGSSGVTTGTECSNTSSSSTLHQAAALITANHQTQLQPIVAKIQKIPDYQQDPNCLYILETYYFNVSDSQNASLYLGKLHAVYDPKQGFSPAFGGDVLTIQDFNADVAALEKTTQQIQNNIEEIPNR